ncbi:MAG: type II toxin-antitoxin system YafQ family toxin [Candidatus Gastranaerophilales bacterium]|nr:type II toxin-antitoxin system YafQ family toxin [Candidatus Gastranaerophilales bacterium]
MKRDVKLMKKRGKDIEKLIYILDILALGKPLPEKNKDHQLQGEYKEFRECHIEPDWLLIYRIEDNELYLYATATGSHSDLFNM